MLLEMMYIVKENVNASSRSTKNAQKRKFGARENYDLHASVMKKATRSF